MTGPPLQLDYPLPARGAARPEQAVDAITVRFGVTLARERWLRP